MSVLDVDKDAASARIAGDMAAAAVAWLETLDADQRAAATGDVPGATPGDAERQRWFYTPTDHGGLTLHQQRPAQQQLAHHLVATGLSTAGYVTVATILGLENVLDHTEGWQVDWGRERGRDPGMYYLRIFGAPGGPDPWGWRFGGHHVSLNFLIVGGRVRAMTPCFLGADPATAPLLGPASLRPLGSTEDLARELVQSLDPEQAARAVLLDRAPSDIIGGNRPRLADGDGMIHLPELWNGLFTEPRLVDAVTEADRRNEAASGYDQGDHRRLALTDVPQGIAARDLTGTQRDLLRTLLGTYLGRVADELSPLAEYDEAARLDAVHLAWAGPAEAGHPTYYRLQGPGLLIEYDNAQRKANHAHAVWRDPGADFGTDVLAQHWAAHHR